VVVEDLLPQGAVYQSMGFVPPASGTIDPSGPRWILSGTIPIGGVVEVTASVRITSPLASGTILTNTAAVTATNNQAWVYDSLTTPVQATNSILLGKVVEPTLVGTGEVVTYTVIFTNTGNGIADVLLEDVLDANFNPPFYSAQVDVPGRTWDTPFGVSTHAFTATAPSASGTYYNQQVTATYDGTQVEITQVAPVQVVEAIAGLTLDSDSPTLIQSSTAFTASITAGANVSYILNFGDGSPVDSGSMTPGTPIYISHTYATTGTYTAVLTATNAAGSRVASTTVMVVDDLLADLVITDMWVEPALPFAGQPITLHVTVRNQGWSPTEIWSSPDQSWFVVEVYAKPEGFVPPGPPVDVFDHAGGYEEDRSEYVAFPSGLMPEEEVELQFRIVLTATSVYSLYAQVDVTWDAGPPWGQPYGLIREMNEGNNIYSFGTLNMGGAANEIFLPVILKGY
jgi:uncharacterized repeat protein (TIGR01451 family)